MLHGQAGNPNSVSSVRFWFVLFALPLTAYRDSGNPASMAPTQPTTPGKTKDQTPRKSGQPVGKKKVRSDQARTRRSMKERLRRLTGQKLRTDQEWMLEATDDLRQLSAWMARQEVQQGSGLLPLRVGVLGDGRTPDDCRVLGLPPVPEDASCECLYMRLCELECLRSHTTDVMASLAERLIARGFLVPCAPATGSSHVGSVQCGCGSSDCEC